MSQQRLKIPETLAGWPWLRTINPHYSEVKAESSAWFESFKAFNSEAQTAFNCCDYSLLASLGSPLASKDHLRTACDLMNLFFVIDEYTDRGDGAYATIIASIIMDALHNPSKPRPHGESVVGEIARQFWARTVPIITARCRKRFIEAFDSYLESVVAQACDRSKMYFRSIKEYVMMRRENIGAKPYFVLLQGTLDIPDLVMDHPSIKTMFICSIDMIFIANDLYSFKVEHARGDDGCNIVTIAKRELGLGLEHTVRWVGEYNKEARTTFLTAMKDVPSWGPEIDKQVSEYIFGMANWVRANDSWSFESRKYFGTDGRVVEGHRVVDLACGHPDCSTDVDCSTKGVNIDVFC